MTRVIDISSSALKVRILSKGATLAGVRFADDPRNLVLGFAEPDDHARVPAFAGHLAGPVANRIRAGRVEIDGVVHHMPLNEANRTTLHSGPDGLHAQDWAIKKHHIDNVTLTCTLPDGCNGLPGNRTFTATYGITDSTLRLTITATSDQSTPINIASHPYWNLDGGRDVSGHTLQVAAKDYLPTDAHNLPKGNLRALAGTPHDFQHQSPVPLDPALDLNFCLSDSMRAEPVHVAQLSGQNGTTLRIATTCPGLQVYSGAHLPDLPVAMADCPAIAPYSGIALEPQHWPDAPHHTHFPNILIAPGEKYRQVTDYILTKN